MKKREGEKGRRRGMEVERQMEGNRLEKNILRGSQKMRRRRERVRLKKNINKVKEE